MVEVIVTTGDVMVVNLVWTVSSLSPTDCRTRDRRWQGPAEIADLLDVQLYWSHLALAYPYPNYEEMAAVREGINPDIRT